MNPSNPSAVARDRSGHGYWVMLTTALAAAGYAATAQTSVGFHDAAELSLRAAQLGATHAPGAPLHTLLGYAATGMLGDAAAATTWVSVVAAAGTAGVVTALLCMCRLNPWLSACGGLAYATTYTVWTNAVVTELYALSTLLAALLLMLAWRWRCGSRAQLPLAVTWVYGLALSAHFGNVVLLPAYAVLLVLASSRGAGARHLLSHLGLLLLCIVAIAAANAALAARVTPFGPYVPDSLSGLLLYMAGAEHTPLHSIVMSDFLARVFEHVIILAQSYAFVGLPFAIWGLYRMLRGDPPFALFQVLFFGGYMGYFTLFGSGDYFVMVVPGYLLLSVWLVLGADSARRSWLIGWPAASAAMVPLALVGWSLLGQLEQRATDAAAAPAEAFAERAFSELPPNSLVIARWNEFTVLRYRQVLAGLRDDVELIVPARSTRHYAHGTVPDYLQLVAASVCVRPVVANRRTAELDAAHELRPLAPGSAWLRVYPVSAQLCEQGIPP